MKDLAFKERLSGHSEEHLEEIEKLIGSKIPTEYRKFLGRVNGGLVYEKNSYFSLKGSTASNTFGDGFFLEKFFPVHDPEYSAHELLNVIQTYMGRIPPDMLPIGANDFGDLVLLGFASTALNQVYLWDHEHEGLTPETRRHKNVYKIADSFSGFICKLENSLPHSERIWQEYLQQARRSKNNRVVC